MWGEGGGGVSSTFRAWKLISMKFRGPVCGITNWKAQCPHRYALLLWVGCRSNPSQRAKWSDVKFWGSRMIIVFNTFWYNPRK